MRAKSPANMDGATLICNISLPFSEVVGSVCDFAIVPRFSDRASSAKVLLNFTNALRHRLRLVPFTVLQITRTQLSAGSASSPHSATRAPLALLADSSSACGSSFQNSLLRNPFGSPTTSAPPRSLYRSPDNSPAAVRRRRRCRNPYYGAGLQRSRAREGRFRKACAFASSAARSERSFTAFRRMRLTWHGRPRKSCANASAWTRSAFSPAMRLYSKIYRRPGGGLLK